MGVKNCLEALIDHRPYTFDSKAGIRCEVIKRIALGLIFTAAIGAATYMLAMSQYQYSTMEFLRYKCIAICVTLAWAGFGTAATLVPTAICASSRCGHLHF